MVTLPNAFSSALGKFTRTDLFLHFLYFTTTNTIYHINLTSELTLEKAKVGFIFASIVTRRWIMHAMKVLGVVFFCEV